MESHQIAGADYLDIIFTNRNKNYGSYVLRKEYDKRALKAIGIVLFLTLCTTVIPYIVSYFHPQDIAGPIRRVPAVILGPEVLIPETKATPSKAIMPEAAAPPRLPKPGISQSPG